MKKITVLLVAAFSLSASAAVAETNPTTTPNASQQCKTLRTQLGDATFKATYGTNKNKSNAHGKCVSQMAKKQANVQSTSQSQCKAEDKADPVAFKAKYGTNKNKNNAFGKCVSAAATAASKAQTTAIVNAAKQCKAERAADVAAFKAKYGTNKNKANAFGKCVSKLAGAKS